MYYELKLEGNFDIGTLQNLKAANKKEGLKELYSELIFSGECSSYNRERIFNIANILNKNQIRFKLYKGELLC